MSPEPGPAARALLALELIQLSPGISGETLAERLGVSDRAARRSIAILREAGVPVESISGPYGGYRLGRGARLPPLTFSTPEALGIVMAVLRGWHGSMESPEPAAVAISKIMRVIPAPAVGPAEAMRRILAQNAGDAAANPDPMLTATLAHAAEDRQRLSILYRNRAGTESEFDVDAWAVVVRHGRWYLLCWSHTAHARRVLRIDRIVEADRSGDATTLPEDLDPVREVEAHLADGWTHDVEVLIELPIGVASPCFPRVLGRLTPHGNDSCQLRGSTDEPDWYAAQLAATQLPFVIIQGDAVRSAVLALANRLAHATNHVVEPR